jgi:hypothetical protein
MSATLIRAESRRASAFGCVVEVVPTVPLQVVKGWVGLAARGLVVGRLLLRASSVFTVRPATDVKRT